MTARLALSLAVTLATTLATDPAPTVTLSNGVKMPLLAAGVYQYNDTEADDSISAAISVGFQMFDNALDYWNQDGVSHAIHRAIDAGSSRDHFFVETKVPGCGNPLENTTRNPFDCYKSTVQNLESDLQQLNLTYVDLVLLHFPPFPSFVLRSCNDETGSCEMARQQWRAMQEFQKAGKARALGVSNFCQSCLECLAKEDTFPQVNQVMFHLGSGMNKEAQDLLAYHKAHGVMTQAYSVLGNTPWGKHASNDILHGNLTTSIAMAHNKSTVEVALKWVVDQGIPAVTKSSSPSHLASDLDLWSWNLTVAEKALLDQHKSADSPTYPSYGCSK